MTLMTSAATCGGSGGIELASTKRVKERSKIPAWQNLAGGEARKASNGLKPGLPTNDLRPKGAVTCPWESLLMRAPDT